MKTCGHILMGTLLALIAMPVFSGQVTIPNTFTSGTPAVAADVNANFSAAKAAVDDNDNRISALENVKTAYLNIPAAAFVATDNSTDYDNEGSWNGARITTNTGTGNYVAAVYLPHGATVTAFTYSFFDASGTDDTVAELRRAENRGALPTSRLLMATVSSSGSGTWGSTTTTTIRSPAIDTDLYNYYVKVTLPSGGLFLYGIKIKYTYTL